MYIGVDIFFVLLKYEADFIVEQIVKGNGFYSFFDHIILLLCFLFLIISTYYYTSNKIV